MPFENLPNAILAGNVPNPTPEQTKFADEKLDDEVALNIVVRDVEIALSHVSTKARPQEWNDIDDLFRATVTPQKWDNGNEFRASLSMPLILEVIETILPQLFLGFFSDKTTPFLLTAKGKTTQVEARAIAKVLEWAIKQSGFKEEIRKMLKSCLQYGMCIGKWGWKVCTQRRKEYSRDEKTKEVVSETKEEKRSYPTFENCELGNIIIDPNVRSHDIQEAKFLVLQKFYTGYELDELRDNELYSNIPSREELKRILSLEPGFTTDSLSAAKVETFRTLQAQRQNLPRSTDPLQSPLEVLEYWSEDRVIVVLQRCLVLRNDDNEDDCLPFNSCAFVDVLHAFYGLGISMILAGEQKLQAGVVNKWIDALDLALNPMFQRKKGVGPSQQNIKSAPGRVVNDDGELNPIQFQANTGEALSALQTSEARAKRRVGANSGPDMPNQAMRTAEGVQEFTSGIQVRMQYFIEMFSDFVFVPVLEAFVSMCKDNLSPEDIDKILTEADGKTFEGTDHLSIYNGTYSIEVLTSTKLAGRRAMSALVPQLMQLFMSAPVQQGLIIQNKKVDMAEFVEEVIDLVGWDDPGFIVDMTPEDGQRAMNMNPAVQRTQGNLMVENARSQAAAQLEQDKGDVRGGLQVVKHILDQSGQHDAAQRELMTNLLSAPQQPLSGQPPQPGASNTLPQ